MNQLTEDVDQVPIIAPFLGCTFGGWIYDMFLYTGAESPVNTPYIGLRRLITPLRPRGHNSGSHV